MGSINSIQMHCLLLKNQNMGLKRKKKKKKAENAQRSKTWK